MSATNTPNLGMPYVQPNQSQPNLTINESLDILDAAVGGQGVSIAVKQFGVSPAGEQPTCKTLIFEGASVFAESDDVARVVIETPSGGGGGSITVEDLTVSPHVTIDDVTTIRLSGNGVVVTMGSDGVAELAISGEAVSDSGTPCFFQIACSDLVTALSTGTNNGYFRAPHAFTITAVRSSVLDASSSGLPTVDIKNGGVSILSTALSIDATEFTSVTAATPAVVSSPNVADDDMITVDITTAGTGTKGLIVTLIGTF